MADEFITPATPAPTPIDPFEQNLDTDSNTDAPEEIVDPFKGTKHKIKSKGKEVELDYDELRKRAEKADGADQIFQEQAQVRKQLKEMESKLGKLSAADQDNFLEMVEIIGWEKAQKFANTLVKKQIEWEELSDHEQQRILKDQEAEEAKAELAKLKGKEQDANAQRDRSIAMDLIDKEVGEALAYAKENGLSIAEAPRFAEKVVDELLAYLEFCEAEEKAGREVRTPPPTAVDVAKMLQSRKTEGTQSFLKKLDAKSLRSMLSPEQLKELRQSEIDDLYTPIPRNASKRQVTDESINPFQSKKEEPRGTNDWFAAMDKALGVKK